MGGATHKDDSDLDRMRSHPPHYYPNLAMSLAPPTNLAGDTTTSLELAQALMEQLTIRPKDWHRLKANRKARSQEQLAAALVFLLKDQPEEALARLQQATGWLDKSLSAPPCPTHGNH